VVSWTETDWRKNNKDLNGDGVVKTFAVASCGRFRKIGLRQTGPNHRGENDLVVTALELFGTVAGLQ
jgi:hypothetical protein